MSKYKIITNWETEAITQEQTYSSTDRGYNENTYSAGAYGGDSVSAGNWVTHNFGT